MASLFGQRFSVVTTLEVSVPVLSANVSHYGLDRNLGRIRASGVPVLALEHDRSNATEQVRAEIRAAVRNDNINSVVLGCAGMAHIVEESDDISIKLIDGVHAAVRFATML